MQHGGGLSPTMSVLVPLFAAFIGASAGGLVRLALDWRAQRADFRAAALVLYDVLVRVQHLTWDDRDERKRATSAARVFGDVDRFDAAERRLIARGLLRHYVTWIETRTVLGRMPDYRDALQKAETPIDFGQGLTMHVDRYRGEAEVIRDEIIESLEIAMSGLERRTHGRRLWPHVRLWLYDHLPLPQRWRDRVLEIGNP